MENPFEFVIFFFMEAGSRNLECLDHCMVYRFQSYRNDQNCHHPSRLLKGVRKKSSFFVLLFLQIFFLHSREIDMEMPTV